MLLFVGTTLDEPLYYMNSTRILARTGMRFYLIFTHSLKACQVPPQGIIGIQNYAQVGDSGNPVRSSLCTEAVDPIEVRLKSPRIELANIEHNGEALRLNLDLIEEKREQVLKRVEDYHRKTVRYYDQRVKPRSYKPGELVLKKLLPARKDPSHGKVGPNWEGPYIISRIIRPGNYELQTEEGKTLPHSWNAEHLKRFYQYDPGT